MKYNIYSGLVENVELYRKAKEEILSNLPYVKITYSNNEGVIGKCGYLIQDTNIINFILGTNYLLESCFCVMGEKITIIGNEYNILEVIELK